MLLLAPSLLRFCSARGAATAATGGGGASRKKVVAPDGPSGVSLFKTAPEIALVLSDFSMSGGMTGVDVALTIRKIEPSMALIIMSGYTGVIPTLETPELANIEVIPKPFTMVEISQVLRKVLDQKTRIQLD